MKKVYILLLGILLQGCIYQDVSFTEADLYFTKPFYQYNTAVYSSQDNRTDTIIFFPRTFQVNKVRHIMQGFYNSYSYNVNYKIIGNSYHKLFDPNETEPETRLFSIGKSSSNPKSAGQEFCFLGLIFNETFLEKIETQKKTQIQLDESQAQYSGMNINKGIKSFVFHIDSGILSYIDYDNITWTRTRLY